MNGLSSPPGGWERCLRLSAPSVLDLTSETSAARWACSTPRSRPTGVRHASSATTRWPARTCTTRGRSCESVLVRTAKHCARSPSVTTSSPPWQPTTRPRSERASPPGVRSCVRPKSGRRGPRRRRECRRAGVAKMPGIACGRNGAAWWSIGHTSSSAVPGGAAYGERALDIFRDLDDLESLARRLESPRRRCILRGALGRRSGFYVESREAARASRQRRTCGPLRLEHRRGPRQPRPLRRRRASAS